MRIRDPESARASILKAAERILRRGGLGTVDQVAREANCAKGLVHYHYHTKSALLAAVAARLGQARRERWARTFASQTPDGAIRASWNLLVAEHADGSLRAWLALLAHKDKATGRVVSSEMASFAEALTQSASRWLAQLGLAPTVTIEEIGSLIASVVWGTGLLLAAGTAPSRLQGAYDAAWAAVLSLTRPVLRA